MNILVTGAKGFVGKNLVAALENLRDGKDQTRPGLAVEEVFACGRDTAPELLEDYCARADFVFHLAGVNRPKDSAEFMEGNCGFTAALLDALRRQGNACPVLYASSIHAAGQSDYGKSKRAGEELVFAHARETGAEALVYRFPNLFGKWCRPDYNCVVATFCHNAARSLPITVHDRDRELELLYIDDLLEELLNAREGHPHRGEGGFCSVQMTHRVTLGEIAGLLEHFQTQPVPPVMQGGPEHSFERKLYSTYLSYLPREKVAVPLKMNADHRGSFTELLRTADCGQVSVNILKPGVTKGQHWHHSKWECFVVVAGSGLIRMRQVGGDEVLEFQVSGARMEAVFMLPGYTHSITNLSQTDDLVTVIWANEPFAPDRPDTFYEKVI